MFSSSSSCEQFMYTICALLWPKVLLALLWPETLLANPMTKETRKTNFRIFFETKYQFTSSRNSLLQSHLKSLTIRGSRHKLWNCAIWHCSTVSLRNSLDFRSTLDTEAAYSEANRLVTIDTTKVTKVVYMSSKILQLTVGSHDVSQDEKNCWTNHKMTFHPGPFCVNFVN